MGQPIDANGTQAVDDWRQIDWQKVEKAVLRLQHRIFMAKVKGDVKGMESLQRLLASSRAAKLLAPRVQHGQEPDPRAQVPGIGGHLQQRRRHGLEQQVVHRPRVLQGQRAQRRRQRGAGSCTSPQSSSPTVGRRNPTALASSSWVRLAAGRALTRARPNAAATLSRVRWRRAAP